MGFFDFFGSSGPDIFGGKALKEVTNAGRVVKDYLVKIGLPIDHVKVWPQSDDSVEVAGWVKDKSLKEKIIVAVGNLKGISKVHDLLAVGSPPDYTKPSPAKAAPAAAPAVAVTAVKAEAEPEMPKPSQAEVDAVKFESRTYTVVKGDTLSKIAKAMYGNANKYPEIFEANKPMLSDPDKIYPGQVLRIP
jgi:nucleoid-associated protein YgaU